VNIYDDNQLTLSLTST